MIVDCHTHVDFSQEGSAADHLAAAEAVDACIVLADEKGSTEQANKKLADYLAAHKDKMVGFAVVKPLDDNVGIKAVTALREKQGFSGAVLYCSSTGFHPAHSRAMKFYASAQQVALPVFFHNGGTLGADAVLDYAQPYLLDEVAREFNELKIVIGSMGTPFVDQTIAMVAKHENVYADLTIRPGNVWQVYNIVMAAYERGVLGKLLFGSGFPAGRPGECIEMLLGFNKLLGDSNFPTVPRAEIRHIIERDSLALLGIPSVVKQAQPVAGE